LQNHLESVLASEPVTVKSGAQIVEVTPQVWCSVSWGITIISIWWVWTLAIHNCPDLPSFPSINLGGLGHPYLCYHWGVLWHWSHLIHLLGSLICTGRMSYYWVLL
jgi:hypothetical protein